MEKKRLVFIGLAVVAVVGTVWLWHALVPSPVTTLPDASDVETMVATLYNSPTNAPDIPYFDVPADHFQKVLDALRPATRDLHPMKWVVMGELGCRLRNGQVVFINLYRTNKDVGAFSIGYRSNGRPYFRGGTDQGIERAVRLAFEATKKGT